VRRTAAFIFSNAPQPRKARRNSAAAAKRSHFHPIEYTPASSAPMADERHQWFLTQIFRHRAALYRYLRKFTSGAEDIEDLVQETYVRVYALSCTQAVESPRALLFRIAHNTAVERARRQKGQATDNVADLERLTVYSSDAPAEEQIDARRGFESFCAAVDRLPPLCRRVFVLRKVYRLSHDEIAEVLGVSHSTIEKHVAKGLVRCRDYLRDAGLLDGIEAKDRPGTPRRLRDVGDGE
jgi:RNA polymerase sigma factor (sigma-70 family)